MGQKVHPIGIRLGIIKDWSAKWYAGNSGYAATLAADLKIREFIARRLANAALSRVVIDRPSQTSTSPFYRAPGHCHRQERGRYRTPAPPVGEDERRRAGAGRGRGNPQAGTGCQTGGGKYLSATGKTNHVSPGDEARGAEFHAPRRQRHQGDACGPAERRRNRPAPNGTGKGACHCIRCAPT